MDKVEDNFKFKLSDDEKIKLLADLISFKSVNDYELDVAQYIKKFFEKYGIDSKIIPINDTRANLVAEVGSGSPVLAISGHMDVVSEGDTNDWETDPFELVEKSGKLYGRGTTDMKSGLAAMIVAMIELKKNGLLQNNGTLRFMATVGEEVGEKGSADFYDKGFTNDIDALVIGEPSGDEIIYGHRGSMDVRITSYGEMAHSSIPEKGYNALDPVVEFLNDAKHYFESITVSDKELGKLTYNTTILNAGKQVNTIPDKATAEMNIRTIPEFSNKMVSQVLDKLVKKQNDQGANMKLDIYMSQEPVLKQKDNRLVELADQSVENNLNTQFQRMTSPGVTDASNLLKGHSNSEFPFIMFGPGETKMAHKVNEFVDKQRYLSFSNIYDELILSYFNKFSNTQLS